MSKRIFLNSLAMGILMVFFMGSHFSFAQGPKIGYVELSRVFDEYHKTSSYDAILEAKNKKFEEERNKKVEEIRNLQSTVSLLVEEKKKEVEGEIEKKKAELIEFDRQNKTDLTKERNEKIREILLEIEKVVSDYAEKNGYDVILNDRVLIYGKKTMNLTQDILGILNKDQPDQKSQAKDQPKSK